MLAWGRVCFGVQGLQVRVLGLEGGKDVHSPKLTRKSPKGRRKTAVLYKGDLAQVRPPPNSSGMIGMYQHFHIIPCIH